MSVDNLEGLIMKRIYLSLLLLCSFIMVQAMQIDPFPLLIVNSKDYEQQWKKITSSPVQPRKPPVVKLNMRKISDPFKVILITKEKS